jgi:hypothetical protein
LAATAATDSTSPEEAVPLYMDYFEDMNLSERLIGSIQLLFVIKRLTNSDSETCTESTEGGEWEESAATRSTTQALVIMESLAQKWHIRLDKAHAMLRASTQTGLQMVVNPLACQYTTRLLHMWYTVVIKTFHSDTMLAKMARSLQQHTRAQVITDGVGSPTQTL